MAIVEGRRAPSRPGAALSPNHRKAGQTVLKLLASAGIVLALAAPARATTTSMVQLSGKCWETGGAIPSQLGDELTAVGTVTSIRKPLFWSPSRFSYTWAMSGLVSTGESVYGTTRVTEYAGGIFRMHVDALPSNAVYGVNPPNATAPATFIDGASTYLEGNFTSFTMTLNTSTQAGSLFGSLTFTGGNAYPQLTDPAGWTVGATLTRTAPEGWDADVNATLFVSGPLGVDAASWASIKSLYR